MPAFPECLDDENDPANWGEEARFVDVLCICGSRFFDAALAESPPPPPSSDGASMSRRELQGTAPWVDPHTSDHLNASRACRSNLYDFKRKWM